MNGYLNFLKSLSEYQQRAEIGHLVFTERLGGSSLEEDLMKMPAVVAFSKTLGVDPNCWTLELKHYAEEADSIGIPVFGADRCWALFRLRYVKDAKTHTPGGRQRLARRSDGDGDD
jgi:hypothetical protein